MSDMGVPCERCGFENDPGARRCEACGNVLASPTEPIQEPDSERISLPPSPGGPPQTPDSEPIRFPPPGAPPDEPTVQRPRGPDRWPAIRRVLLGLEVVGALGFGVLAFVDGRYGYLWATAAFGVVPLAYALVAAVRGPRRPAGVAVAILLVVVLVGSAFAVVTNCDNRLTPGGDLSGCDFADVDLAGLDLSGANLSKADLSGADLSGANLSRANLSGTNGAGAQLSRANLSEVTGVELNLKGANLARANLTGADLTGADLRDADLGGTNLSQVNLSRADLRDHDFSGADFAGQVLSGADLTGTIWVDAVLLEARLDGARLVNANLAKVSADEADFSGAVLDGATFVQAQLDRATFDGASMEGTNLEKVGAEEASFEGATMSDINLDGALMTDATGFTDPELAEALGIDLSELGSFTAERFIRLESRFDIIPVLGKACLGRAVEGAAAFKGPGLHPLVAAGPRGGHIQGLGDRPRDLFWEPAALRFGELVACVEPEEEITVEVCQYVTTSGAPGKPTRRVRFRRTVRLVEASTAKVLFTETYEGSFPDQCPFSKTSVGTTGEDRIEGSKIGFDRFRPRLAEFVR
ncbi:MAG: pentapeptide repeat-containing protein [Actinomycetota bacterium]